METIFEANALNLGFRAVSLSSVSQGETLFTISLLCTLPADHGDLWMRETLLDALGKCGSTKENPRFHLPGKVETAPHILRS